jgi:tetratricopeptide (TPR) repeat protein
LGLNWWGVNSMSYTFGYSNYYNPYYDPTYNSAYNYSQPLVYVEPAESADASAAAAAQPPEPRPGAEAAQAARDAFMQRDYAEALSQAEKAIKAEPDDPVMHQLRALALFAEGRFSEAAAVVHTVLATSPGWDWTTMIGFYQDPNDYTKQLRALEQHRDANEDDPATRFLLAYHYITLGHDEDARVELEAVVRLQPRDRVAANLLRSLRPAEGEDAPVPPVPAPENATPIDPAKLLGQWNATRDDGAKFNLSLNEQDQFVWGYTQAGKTQDVSGTYRFDQNTLVMEPTSGGALAAAVELTDDGGLAFRILGGDPSDPGLVFRKTK